MPAHSTVTAPLRVKLPREHDTGHLIRGVGYFTECVCGWRSSRCATYDLAMADGREHLREHGARTRPAVLPPPGTVPPPAAGEATQATREREG